MNEKWIRNRFLATFVLILAVVFFSKEPVWGANNYVEPNGTGTACSRLVPCDFAYAIDNATAGNHIIFKQGTYKRTASSVLRIIKELYLYGGWNGSRFGDLLINPELYPSILDGEGLRPVAVVLGPIQTIISGFTAQNGNARDVPGQEIVCQGDYPSTGCGGGIYVYEAQALIASNKILNNQANGDKNIGGGVHLESTSGPILINNLIQGNQAFAGGGLSIIGSTSAPPKIQQNNRFIHNIGAYGSGIFFHSQPIQRSTTIFLKTTSDPRLFMEVVQPTSLVTFFKTIWVIS